MLLMSERVRPCSARLSRSLSGRLILTALPSDSTFMAGCQANSSFPLGPSTLILPSASATLTPAGMDTGCLPIRDIAHLNSKSEYRNPKQIRILLPHVAEQLAAQPLCPRLAVAHDAAAGADHRN